MKHEKKYEIMGLLDDRIYEEVLQKREELTRGGVHRTGNRLRRMLLIAACVALLAVGVTAAFLPAMLSDPGVDTPPTAESESTASPFPDAEWVEDPTIVQVQRLSVGGNFDTASVPTAKDDSVTVETEQCLGERLILLQFRCREGERITVTPDGGGALFETVQIEYNQYPCWSVWNPEKEEYYPADEYLKVNTEEKRAFLGRSVTITKDTVLVWQYPDLPRPCREDNFVDFTVTDSEGRITGGGSVYIGGLDLTTVSENKTYYGGGAGRTDVYLNASYRPVLLGAYRYTEGGEVDADTHAAKLTALHSEAERVRQGLFDDLSEDYFRLSYRILLLRYKTDRFYGISTFTIHHDVSYTKNLTDAEIATDPLKDYYTYTWEEASPRPNGKPIKKETDTQGAGRIYRIYIGAEKETEECVFQLTYKDIPVRIKNFEIDGEVIYLSFHNYEGFKNFYNQNFIGNEYETGCQAIVDLQNGSMTLIETPNEE